EGTNLYEYARSRATFALDPEGTADVAPVFLAVHTQSLIDALSNKRFSVRERTTAVLEVLVGGDQTGTVEQQLRLALQNNPPLEARCRIERILRQSLSRKLLAQEARRLIGQLESRMLPVRKKAAGQLEAWVGNPAVGEVVEWELRATFARKLSLELTRRIENI